MDPQTVALIIGAGGLGGLLTGLAKGIQDWRSGEHQREKEVNQDALTQRDAAVRQRDQESAYRRVIAEHASIVRRIALEYGVPLDAIPPFPSNPSKDHHP